METIELDGSQGEGGGQILRTALSLSMITGRAFRIKKIRAGRKKPGLLRQHLTAVNAAREVCGAAVSGAELGSQTLSFDPGAIKGGDYRYAIGTAGSCTLVLQTVLPALWFADASSTLSVSGGTHNSAAPPVDFLMLSWLPILQRMGVDMQMELIRHGFYPAGGGEVHVRVDPCKQLRGLCLSERGALIAKRATAVVAGIPAQVARRELERLARRVDDLQCAVRERPACEGPGNVLLLELQFEAATIVLTEFGEKGLPAESVADRLAQQAVAYLAQSGCADEYLSDQLVLPMALAGGGRFSVAHISSHLQTNLDTVRKFLPIDARTEICAGRSWVSVEGAPVARVSS